MRDAERESEAGGALDRVTRESETIGSSSLSRIRRHAGNLFTAKDAVDETGGGDAVEIWGRRIGRALSLIGVIVLAYLVGAQLRLW